MHFICLKKPLDSRAVLWATLSYPHGFAPFLLRLYILFIPNFWRPYNKPLEHSPSLSESPISVTLHIPFIYLLPVYLFIYFIHIPFSLCCNWHCFYCRPRSSGWIFFHNPHPQVWLVHLSSLLFIAIARLSFFSFNHLVYNLMSGYLPNPLF